MQIETGRIPDGEILIYEYGVRLDKEAVKSACDQIGKARHLYNDVIAVIREIMECMQEFALSQAGPAAGDLRARIDTFTAAFDEAKARDDRKAMQKIADERRRLWRSLGEMLKETRRIHGATIQQEYLSRIGKNSASDTYRLRCRAVADGLGWATANAVLDSALMAFKKSLAKGRAPRFAVGADKNQDTLTLQFTAAGGVPVDAFLAGSHGELSLLPTQGCGPRRYGQFRFRLGTAGAHCYATGTWQYHRPLPAGANVCMARLIRRRIGKDYRWYLQLVVKPPEPVRISTEQRKPLAAVHFGWAADSSGRRVAGIADSADPAFARLLRLPARIEESLERAAAIQRERDLARDELVPKIKAVDLATLPDALHDEFRTIRRLPVQYVAPSRLHRLFWLCQKEGLALSALSDWRGRDRLRWQAATHLARRARNARRDFYRNEALELARRHDALVIEPLDLAEAAAKVDQVTGERNDMARKARSGRVVAAIHEFESALRWACAKTGTAVLELRGKTVRTCSLCGGTVAADPKEGQILHCNDCGAALDRKQNGAAVAWQAVAPRLADWIEAFQTERGLALIEKRTGRTERQERQVRGRRNALAQRGG